MENISAKEGKKTDKRKSSKEIRISTSGRHITTPKHLQTTSSDEQPPPKQKRTSKNIKAEIERLKNCAAVINKKNLEERDAKTVENSEKRSNETKQTETKGSRNTDVFTLETSNGPADPSSLNTLNSVAVKTTIKSKTTTKGIKSTPPSEKAAAVLENIRGRIADNYNKGRSATGLSKVLLPESTNTEDNRKNISSKTIVREMRNPPLPKHIATENRIDKVFDETTPMSFQKDIEQKLEELRRMNETLIEQNKTIIKVLNDQLSTRESKLGETLMEQNKEIIKILNDQLSTRESKLGKTLYEPLKGFPITTVAQFKELDHPTNSELRRKVYDHLLRLGGSKLREFLSCGLKEIMTDGLLCEFTWNETATTQRLGDTKVSNVLYQAAKNCPLFCGPENKHVYKTEMLQVLRATKQRFRHAQKKNPPNDTINDTAEEEEDTEENIERRISQLEAIMRNSDADDEEDFESDHLEDD